MATGRVVVASHDAGGTVPPMLALAETFVSRGLEVTWLGQPSIEERAVAAGCSFLPFEGVPNYAAGVPIENQPSVAMPLITGRRIGEQLLAVATEQGCDLTVVDANLAGCAAAAETLGRPSGLLLHSMYATFTETWFADLWPFLGPGINETREHFGLGPCNSWADVFAGHDRLISVVPDRLDSPVVVQPTQMRHWGFLVPRTHLGKGPGFLEGHRPRVLVGLSTTYQQQEQLLQHILDALGSLEVSGVASTSGQVDASALRCPPNVVVREFADHTSLLPDADVMITHAGLGTVAAALNTGVPLVCTPLGRDQHLNAERVVSVGAGLTLGTDPDPAAIADAVETVLADEAYRAAALRIADEGHQAGGPGAAVDDLMRLFHRAK